MLMVNSRFKARTHLSSADRSLGCNELIFNPLIHWWRLGPINKQLRVFLWSDAPIHYKVGMMSCKWHLPMIRDRH